MAPFYNEPKEKLILPEIDTSNAQFFDIYYSKDIKDDKIISAVVIKTDSEDLLYIDRNNDEDLTNDGSPYIFPSDENDFTFDIISKDDPKQFVRMLLRRRYIALDPALQAVYDSLSFDEYGNLNKKIAFLYKNKSPDFTGEKGNFYVKNRITLSRGEMVLSNASYRVGLFDRNNNGLYNDVETKHVDEIIIDLNGDGKLGYDDMSEVFSINEIFEIRDENYELTNVDPYGRFFKIEKTDSPAHPRYLKQSKQEAPKEMSSTGIDLGIKIDESFWDLTFKTLNGETVRTKNLKGKYLLLNFWGEWCKGCVMEIPELVYSYNNLDANLRIISFLKTVNLDKAKKMIEDRKMTWYNTLLDDHIAKIFNIKGYPTNILISPEGKILLSTFQVNRHMLQKYIQ